MDEKKSKFHCLGKNCPNHCCGAYNGVSSNFHPLGNLGFTEIVLLPEDVKNLQNANFEDLIRTNSDGFSTIKTAPDGTCMALVDGKCSVYEVRPTLCRAYPLYLDMYVGACALTECGAVNSDLQLADYGDALKNLLDIYQFWIDYYRSKY